MLAAIMLVGLGPKMTATCVFASCKLRFARFVMELWEEESAEARAAKLFTSCVDRTTKDESSLSVFLLGGWLLLPCEDIRFNCATGLPKSHESGI